MQEIKLPITAFKLLFQDKKLFMYALLPGILDLILSSIGLFLLWHFWLHNRSAWFAYPVASLSFLLLWLAFGNLTLIPVEDLIIDQIQLSLWGKIHYPAPPLEGRRLKSELFYSAIISIIFVILILLSFIPGPNFFSFLAAAWITAYGFLSTVYARIPTCSDNRLSIFFSTPLANTALGVFLNILLFVPIFNVWLLGYALILAALVELPRNVSFDN